VAKTPLVSVRYFGSLATRRVSRAITTANSLPISGTRFRATSAQVYKKSWESRYNGRSSTYRCKTHTFMSEFYNIDVIVRNFIR
jgi:hypothetical protein